MGRGWAFVFVALLLLLIGAGCSSSSGSSDPDPTETPPLPPSTVLEAMFPAPGYSGAGPSVFTISALGDMNNDGFDDVVASRRGGLTVLLSRGDGTLAPPLERTLATDTWALAIADFNDDGFLDVAGGNDDAVVCLGNGDGTLADPIDTSVSTSGSDRMVAADMDGDGFQDLISGSTVNAPTLHRGRGDGRLHPASTEYFGAGVFALYTADFNGDDAPDLAALVMPQRDLAVIINDGDGGIAADRRYAFGDYTLGIGDLNGDNLDDIAIHNTNQIITLISLGNGSFAAPQYRPLPANEISGGLAILPLTGGAYQDLVTQSGFLGFNLYASNGNGTYQPAERLLESFGVAQLSVGYVNDDGLPDLVAHFADMISVLLGTEDGRLAGAQSFGFGDAYGQAMVLADFNQDDLLEAIIGHSDGVSMLTGTAGSIFSAPTLLTSIDGNDLIAVDLNDDGYLDIAGATGDTSVALIFGDEAGSFEPAEILTATADTSRIVSADFNNDGLADLAAAHYGPGQVSVFPGEGGGAFGSGVVLDVGTRASDLAVGQFNSDEYPDLAVVDYFSNAVVLFYGGESPLLTPGPAIPLGVTDRGPFTIGPWAVTCADFNQDGFDDLAIMDYGQAQGYPLLGSLSVVLGDGSGNFTESAAFATDAGVDIHASDVTGDDIVDLVITSDGAGDGAVAAFEGVGDGTFKLPAQFTVSGPPATIATGDLNNDGVNDICALRNTLDVLLSTPQKSGDF